jgi:Spy/CpxP family protein refolding chaperone
MNMKHSNWIKTGYMTSALALVLLATSAVHAQPDGKRHDRKPPDIEKRIERLGEELGLSEEQSTELQIVMEAAAAERKALKDQYEEQMKPEMCALHEATMQQVREILTPEQAAEMEDRMQRWALAENDSGRQIRKRQRALQDCESIE